MNTSEVSLVHLEFIVHGAITIILTIRIIIWAPVEYFQAPTSAKTTFGRNALLSVIIRVSKLVFGGAVESGSQLSQELDHHRIVIALHGVVGLCPGQELRQRRYFLSTLDRSQMLRAWSRLCRSECSISRRILSSLWKY
ncbi:uncharacterized protein LOC127010967 [Drosophila biarmipes]|uniref:uncharacterized protein LOC127010967 n=1 Tax=Drosophila biarmipes TaxID=125945 RepID=UPI0021CC6AAB|nr:uncharacterized protein LOC127010967 [Drosophila biarmipes]